jgi:PIN domain nuclease of toxin-antitoxin system
MRVLLDTQTFIWFIRGDSRLSSKARYAIEDTANIRLFSIASLWEMAIKMSIGKLNLGLPFALLIPQQLDENLIERLEITVDHLAVVARLPFHHNDPFDRLLVAQALVEQIPIVSIDLALDAYGVTRLW